MDEVSFVSQAGRNRHEHIGESIELFAREVSPGFAERKESHEAEKRDRLAPAIARALQRRPVPRTPPAGYAILPDHEAWQHVASNGTAAPATRDLARVALAWLLKGRTESQLEWMFGSATGQALIFRGMERAFRGGHADGVEGSLQYVVHGRPRVVRVAGGRLVARPGVEPRPDASLRMRGVTFARITAGQQTASSAAMVGQLQIKADLRLVARLGAALGQPPI